MRYIKYLIEAASDIHPFERAGLGKPPYRFTGTEEKVYQACHDAPQQPGGTCNYCGTGIRFCFWVESADKKKF